MPSSGGQTCALDRKSTRLNSSHLVISYAVFCLKKNHDGVSELAGTAAGDDVVFVRKALIRLVCRVVVIDLVRQCRFFFFFYNATAASQNIILPRLPSL